MTLIKANSVASSNRQTGSLAKRFARLASLLLLVMLAFAQTPKIVTLTFEGLQDNEAVDNYYSGGSGGNGTTGGPNLGVTFGPDSLALVSEYSGGSGNFTNNPSGNTVVYFISGPGVIMNVPSGFTVGFSFYYSAFDAGSVTVYDGLGGTGNVLATINLSANVNYTNCPTDSAGNLLYCNWVVSNNSFNGTAKSVNFSGSADYIAFDNITLNSAIATPPLTITTTTLANGTQGAAYNAPIAASGGTAPYNWSATGLPGGLSISGSAITGTPTVSGTFSNVALTVKDSSNPVLTTTASKPLTIVIAASPLKITTTSLPSGVANSAYSTQVSAVGGQTPYTWSATGLPAGITINTSTGVISGSAASGTYNVSVTVKDSSFVQQTASASFSLVIGAGLTVSTTSLPAGIVGAAYNAPLSASGGASPYTWSATGLPNGLSVNGQAITGTPTTAGTYSVTLTAKDSANHTATTTLPLVVNTASVTIATASLPNGTVGTAYNTTVSASGGAIPYTFSATGLPAGLSINSSGAITGTPTASGTSNVTVSVKDSSTPQLSTSKSFSLTINGQLTFSCTTTNGPTFVGVSYSNTCTAGGGTSPYTLSLSGGSLPAGLSSSIGGTTYTITGKPSSSGAFSFTVQAKDSAGATLTQAFNGTVGTMPTVSAFSLTAVPSVANQYTANLSFTTPPATALTGTVCLTFKPDPSVTNASNYVSQEVQFANGTTNAACGPNPKNTLTFSVPAGSATATWNGGNAQFSQGTVAGTITVTVSTLTDVNNNSVLPTSSASQTVSVAVAQPVLTNTPSLSTTSSTITVVFDAVSSKRGLATASYTFTTSSGPTTVSVSFTSGTFSGQDQSQWFGTASSQSTGGAFSLTATFPCTACSSITAVTVQLFD